MAIKAFFFLFSNYFLRVGSNAQKGAFVIFVATRFVVYNLKSKEYVA